MTSKTIILTLLLFNTLYFIAFGGIIPAKLTCEYMENPAVVDVRQPRLSWVNLAVSNQRSQFQTAYQIRVASSVKKLNNPDLWDSGKVTGDESNRIKYNGKILSSETECWWQVRVWDKNGNVSPWSSPSFWRMGILAQDEWKAKWIGVPWQGEETLPKSTSATSPTSPPPPAPMLRKEFSIDKKIEKAIAYVTGLGYFEFYVNGHKAGNDVLVPNQTNYGKRPGLANEGIPLEDNFREYRVLYLAYDVRHLLKKGENALGAILGNGFYNPAKHWALGYGTPRFFLQMHLTFSDGSEKIVVSDETWKTSQSPILMDMVYYGEHYDARKEQPGWNRPGFNDTLWKPAALKNAPEGKLMAHTSPTDKVMERLKPIDIKKLENGNYRVDFGQEVAGWLKINKVKGEEGRKIEIKYICNTFSGENSYTCKGQGEESYAARFNWFIFSSVEIMNWPGELQPGQVTAEVVYTSVPVSAEFETSNSLLNQINKIWRRSQTDNMHGCVASDCPHRERSPYTGDGQVACATVMHNFDARAFYHKWIRDIFGAQNINTGYVPNGAPWQPGCGGGVAWGAAICIMPWEFYLHFGSKDILDENYGAMQEYIRYMQTWVDNEGIMYSQRTGKDGKVLQWFNLGDWVAPGALPPDEMVHTFFFWRCASFVSKAAKALGKTEDEFRYAQLAEKTRVAFMHKFYDGAKGTFGKAGGNIFALKMGVPDEIYEKVISSLRADIKDNDGHLDTGIFGTQFFFEVLTDHGLHDLAYEAMNKRTEPGFGRWIELGATTTREQWNSQNSQNHPMFGGALTWFYTKLAGMNPDPEKPGYRHIIFKPMPVADLTSAKYSNQTPYGKAGISWKLENEKFLMDLEIPVGCNATVFIPLKKQKRITEKSLPISKLPACQVVGEDSGYMAFKIESGKYSFVSE